MIIKKLSISNFGPFKFYEIIFPEEENATLLLTGKNNEGKTTLINVLKYVNSALKVIGKHKQRRIIENNIYFDLLRQDVKTVRVGRLIFNYKDIVATIYAEFNNNFGITIYFDAEKELIFCNYSGRIPHNISNYFGFIPPLGPIAEREELISISYLKASVDTSLASRHLRNIFYQLLSPEEFELVKKIVNSSWEDILLENYEIDYNDNNRLECFYKERGILREISWAGQGLQIWFQIITHLVLLRDSRILILDEPEINLYPEKQNELISIISQYFQGSIIIATHSMELMNNANISHLVNVKKDQSKPTIKKTNDKIYLEIVRSQIGSRFNFIASQFEDVDNIFFTENISDYVLLSEIIPDFKNLKTFNIPLHGFQQYKTARYFNEAYKLLIGKETNCLVILDRDYYSTEYLDEVQKELLTYNIKLILTEGKEIENYLILPIIFQQLLSEEKYNDFKKWFWDCIESEKHKCQANYVGLSLKYAKRGTDTNSLLSVYLPKFEEEWANKDRRLDLVPGKEILKKIRKYLKDTENITVSNSTLIELAKSISLPKLDSLILKIRKDSI